MRDHEWEDRLQLNVGILAESMGCCDYLREQKCFVKDLPLKGMLKKVWLKKISVSPAPIRSIFNARPFGTKEYQHSASLENE
ncbi:MAG: hypothetical protein V2B20_13390 [Pseudomonadota bacterium]